MKKTKNEHAYSILLSNYPNLVHIIESYDTFEHKNLISIRLWVKGKELPEYVIFEKCRDSEKLHLIHGLPSDAYGPSIIK